MDTGGSKATKFELQSNFKSPFTRGEFHLHPDSFGEDLISTETAEMGDDDDLSTVIDLFQSKKLT